MKKPIAVIQILAILLLCMTSSFADTSVNITYPIPDNYSYYVSDAIEKSEYTDSQIDVDKIFIVENTSHINLRNNLEPIMFWIALPLSGSTDISYAGFQKGELVKAFTNFVSLDGIISPYNPDFDEYISENGLSKPSEVKNMWISERVHVFAFDVICEENEYIIPYYFTEESSFNKMNDDSCTMELGKAYLVEDFISLCEKEAEMYAKYLKDEREKDTKPNISINENGDVIENGDISGSDKKTYTKPSKEDEEESDEDYQITENMQTSENSHFTESEGSEEINKNFAKDLSVEEKVDNLIELGIVEGDLDGNLRLSDNITRAEFSKVVCKVLNAAPAPTYVPSNFSDVDANFWAFGYIETARRYGIIKGYGDDPYYPTFKPYNNITYSESFKMIVEMLGYGLFADEAGGFPDGYKKIALYDLNLFDSLVSNHSKPITRGELFEMLYNALDVPLVEVYNRSAKEFKVMNGEKDDSPLKTLRIALENRQQKMKG